MFLSTTGTQVFIFPLYEIITVRSHAGITNAGFLIGWSCAAVSAILPSIQLGFSVYSHFLFWTGCYWLGFLIAGFSLVFVFMLLTLGELATGRMVQCSVLLEYTCVRLALAGPVLDCITYFDLITHCAKFRSSMATSKGWQTATLLVTVRSTP